MYNSTDTFPKKEGDGVSLTSTKGVHSVTSSSRKRLALKWDVISPRTGQVTGVGSSPVLQGTPPTKISVFLFQISAFRIFPMPGGRSGKEDCSDEKAITVDVVINNFSRDEGSTAQSYLWSPGG